MSSQSKMANPTTSAQDREFEELLRRAARYAKARSSTGLRVVASRKRVKAA
jgi:hypothetical protein